MYNDYNDGDERDGIVRMLMEDDLQDDDSDDEYKEFEAILCETDINKFALLWGEAQKTRSTQPIDAKL